MKMNDKTLWILCGVPGCGKSTFINSLAVLFGGNIVSRDKIRFELLGDNVDHTEYFSHENEVWTTYIQEIKKSIIQGQHTFADATHLDERSRNKLLNALNLHSDVKINIVYFDVPVEVCLERNNKRAGWAHVPASVIRRMATQLVKPTFNERYRYDKIYTVNADGQHCKTETKNGITWALPSTEVACEDCAEAECAGRFSVMRNGGCKYVNIPNK
jgi:predicted kinase